MTDGITLQESLGPGAPTVVGHLVDYDILRCHSPLAIKTKRAYRSTRIGPDAYDSRVSTKLADEPIRRWYIAVLQMDSLQVPYLTLFSPARPRPTLPFFQGTLGRTRLPAGSCGISRVIPMYVPFRPFYISMTVHQSFLLAVLRREGCMRESVWCLRNSHRRGAAAWQS